MKETTKEEKVKFQREKCRVATIELQMNFTMNFSLITKAFEKEEVRFFLDECNWDIAYLELLK